MKEKAPYGIIQSLIYSMLGVIALCAVVLTASAVSNASLPGAKAFPALDRNLDGFLDRREAADSPSLMAVFGEVDTNKDGRLSADEYARAFPATP